MSATPSAPGAVVLASMTGKELVEVINAGPMSAVAPVNLRSSVSLAATGTVQGDAAPVTAAMVNVASGAGNTGILLPPALPGQVVLNNATGNTIKIYPSGTETIDAAGAGAAVTLTSAHRGATFNCFVAGHWVSSLFGAATS